MTTLEAPLLSMLSSWSILQGHAKTVNPLMMRSSPAHFDSCSLLCSCNVGQHLVSCSLYMLWVHTTHKTKFKTGDPTVSCALHSTGVLFAEKQPILVSMYMCSQIERLAGYYCVWVIVCLGFLTLALYHPTSLVKTLEDCEMLPAAAYKAMILQLLATC